MSQIWLKDNLAKISYSCGGCWDDGAWSDPAMSRDIGADKIQGLTWLEIPFGVVDVERWNLVGSCYVDTQNGAHKI